MAAMQILRRARFLVRLVLAWFVLALGVAIASPLVQPQGLELVCAAGGAMKLIVKSEGGGQDAGTQTHTLDCPLCASLGAPPPAPPALAGAPTAQVLRLGTPRAEPLAGRTAAPLPPRGPPLRA